MTEIQIKNLIKEYEKEYIEFMEIEKLPQYKIDFFEINVEESDAAGFASAAQAYYNTKTDEHILRICKSSEIPRYIVFHEFTHILDTEMYAKDYTEEVDNTIIIQKLSKVLFEEINRFMVGWFNEAQVELSFVSYMKIMWPMLQSYFGKE